MSPSSICFLSLIENADATLKNLFRPYQESRRECSIPQALAVGARHQRVTSDTPEDNFHEALAKYGTDWSSARGTVPNPVRRP